MTLGLAAPMLPFPAAVVGAQEALVGFEELAFRSFDIRSGSQVRFSDSGINRTDAEDDRLECVASGAGSGTGVVALDQPNAGSYRLQVDKDCLDGFVVSGSGYGSGATISAATGPVTTQDGSENTRDVVVSAGLIGNAESVFRSEQTPFGYSLDLAADFFDPSLYPCEYVVVGVKPLDGSEYDGPSLDTCPGVRRGPGETLTYRTDRRIGTAEVGNTSVMVKDGPNGPYTIIERALTSEPSSRPLFVLDVAEALAEGDRFTDEVQDVAYGTSGRHGLAFTTAYVGTSRNPGDLFYSSFSTSLSAPVSILPDGMMLPSTEIGGVDPFRSAIDTNGRLVAFVARLNYDRLSPALRTEFADDFELCGGEEQCDLDDDIYVYDTVTGSYTWASNSGDFQRSSSQPVLSADGSHVAFVSNADFDGIEVDLILSRGTDQFNPSSNDPDVFVANLSDPTDVWRVSRTPDATEATSSSVLVNTAPAISDDGRFVAFVSNAGNLDDGGNDGGTYVYLHDRDASRNGTLDEAGDTTMVRVSNGTRTDSFIPELSNNGQTVAYAQRPLTPSSIQQSVVVMTRDAVTQAGVGVPFTNREAVVRDVTRIGNVNIGVTAASYYVRDVNRIYRGATRGINGQVVTARFPELPDSSTVFGNSNHRPVVSDPVNTASGALVADAVDITAPAGSPTLAFGRSYDSSRTTTGALGRSWTTNWDARLVTSIGDPTFVSADGRRYTFTPDGQGGWTRPAELFAELELLPDGSQLEWTDGSIWSFDADGLLSATRTWDAQGVDLERNPTGLITSVVSTTGQSLSMAYGTAGADNAPVLTTVTASDGRVATFDYVESPSGDPVLVTATNPHSTTTYAHDTEARIVSETDATGVVAHETVYASDGRVSQQTMPTGEVTLFAYDDVQRTTTVTDVESGDVIVYAFDALARLASITDPNGEITFSNWNDDGRPAGSTDRLGHNPSALYDANGNVTAVADPVRGTTTYTYDGSNRITTVTESTGAATTMIYEGDERIPSTVIDGLGNSTTFTVEDGLVTSVVDADGVATSYVYDEQRRMSEMTNGLGYSWSYEYDAVGRQTASTTPLGFITSRTFDDAGRTLTSTAADGGVTTYAYDADGRIVSTTDPLGAVTSNTYNPATGLLATTTDPEGRVMTYAYDELSQLVAVEANDGGISETDYGTLGRVTATRDPLGRETTYAYDANGNRTEVVAPDGGVTRTEYDTAGRVVALEDPLGRRTTHAYDEFGRLLSVTRPDGTQVSYTYDLLGRQIETIAPDGGVTATDFTPAGRTASVTDPEDGVTSYAYDAAGQVEAVADPNGFVTAFGYDPDGRRTSVVTPEGLVTYWEYDPMGRITRITDPAGVELARTYTVRGELEAEQRDGDGVVSYAYNADGTMASVADALGNTTTFSYDAAGRQETRVDAIGAVETMEYNVAGELVAQLDRLGQRTEITYDPNGRIDTVNDPSGRSTDHTYDLAGQLMARTFGDGTAISYTYDDLGRRSSMVDPTGTTTYAYDENGRPIEVAAPNGTLGYDYDLVGRRTGLTYPDGATVTYDYDAAGRLVGLTDPNTGDVDYTLDDDGRLLLTELPDGETREFEFVNGQMINHQDHGRVTDLTYNESGRIATLSGAQNHTYTYDEAGQLVEAVQDEGTFAYTYGTRGEITSISDPERSRTFTHNANVEIDTIVDNDGGTGRVSYDEAGRMIEHSDPNGTITNYTYNARGLLVETMITTPPVANADPCSGLTPTRTGTEGDDFLVGTRRADVIFGLGGNDIILGFSGDDILCGGDGNDILLGQSHNDTIYGGDGNDTIVGSFGNDEIDAGEGNDVVFGSFGRDTIQGGDGNDYINGGFGRDTLDGGNGIDIVNGSRGTDTCDDAEHAIRCETTTTNGEPIVIMPGPGTVIGDEPIEERRDLNGDGVLASIEVSGATSPSSQSVMIWDPVAPIPQIANWTTDGASEDLIYGYHREAVEGLSQEHTALGDSLNDGGSWSPYGSTETRNDLSLGYRGELETPTGSHLRARDLDSQSSSFTTRDPLAGVAGRTTVVSPHRYGDNDPINLRDPLGLRASDMTLTLPDDLRSEIVANPSILEKHLYDCWFSGSVGCSGLSGQWQYDDRLLQVSAQLLLNFTAQGAFYFKDGYLESSHQPNPLGITFRVRADSDGLIGVFHMAAEPASFSELVAGGANLLGTPLSILELGGLVACPFTGGAGCAFAGVAGAFGTALGAVGAAAECTHSGRSAECGFAIGSVAGSIAVGGAAGQLDNLLLLDGAGEFMSGFVFETSAFAASFAIEAHDEDRNMHQYGVIL